MRVLFVVFCGVATDIQLAWPRPRHSPKTYPFVNADLTTVPSTNAHYISL